MADVVTRPARVSRKQQQPQGVQPVAPKRPSDGTDIRQEKERRNRKAAAKRDQIAPVLDVNVRMKHEKSKRRSSKKALRVDTHTSAMRSNEDLRSPGQRKSPVLHDNEAEQHIPDFITQTDRYGNATTPRSSQAIQKARKEHPPPEQESNVEACAETFLDSLRLVCCCLAPDEEATAAPDKTKSVTVTEKENVPRLLPPPLPEDVGKKCLVLDLDETLVHSSFRAVPGADFIIPVQVRSK